MLLGFHLKQTRPRVKKPCVKGVSTLRPKVRALEFGGRYLELSGNGAVADAQELKPRCWLEAGKSEMKPPRAAASAAN